MGFEPIVKKAQKVTKRYKKVQKGTEKYKKVQKGTKGYKKVQKGTKIHKRTHTQTYNKVLKGTQNYNDWFSVIGIEPRTTNSKKRGLTVLLFKGDIFCCLLPLPPKRRCFARASSRWPLANIVWVFIPQPSSFLFAASSSSFQSH